jgi:glycerophosphoryl diester phosphodiesterase
VTRPLIIAHRGASAHAPENTIASFKQAVELGADGVEFDVQLARDGVPVIIHDYDLKRTGSIDKRVVDLTSKQLGKIDVGSWFNKKYPRLSKPEFSNEIVPTLEGVLETLAYFDGFLHIELKALEGDHVALAAAVCDSIRDSPLLPKIIVSSFKLGVIPEVRTRLPHVQTSALFAPEIMTYLRRREYIVAIAREFGAHQLSLHHTLAGRRIAELARLAGMPVTVWTVDDPKWILKCQRLGIGSLITNLPGSLLEARDK